MVSISNSGKSSNSFCYLVVLCFNLNNLLLQSLFIKTGSTQATDTNFWFKGCYRLSKDWFLPNESYVVDFEGDSYLAKTTISACFRHCNSKKYSYTTVNGQLGCLCLSVLPLKDYILAPESCPLKCGQATLKSQNKSSFPSVPTIQPSLPLLPSDSHWFPCGALRPEGSENRTENDAIYSVYGSDAPLIVDLEAAILTERILLSQPFQIKIRINMSENWNLLPGFDNPNVLKSFAVEFCNQSHEGVVLSQFYSVLLPLVCSVDVLGGHRLVVKVTSIISEAVTTVNVTTVTPTSDDLKITPLLEVTNSLHPNASCLKMFAGFAVGFEAKAFFKTGSPFNWTISCTEAGLTAVVKTFSSLGIPCLDNEFCTVSNEAITFTTPGLCSVGVSLTEAANSLNVKNSIDFLIMPLEMKDFNVRLRKTIDDSNNLVGSDYIYIALNASLEFEISMETDSISTSLLAVTFGDGNFTVYRVVFPEDFYSTDGSEEIRDSTVDAYITTRSPPALSRVEVISDNILKTFKEPLPREESFVNKPVVPRLPKPFENATIVETYPAGLYNSSNGCGMSMIVSHSYSTEGEYLFNVTRLIYLENDVKKLGSFVAPRKIRALKTLKSVVINLPNKGTDILASGAAVTLTADFFPKSLFSIHRSTWEVLCFPFVQISLEQSLNTTIDFQNSFSDQFAFNGIDNVATFARVVDLPTSVLNGSFSGSGVCLARVRIRNEVSSLASFVKFKVEKKVKAARLRCNVTGWKRSFEMKVNKSFQRLSVGSKISCSLIGFEGSNVSIRWYFGQSSLANSSESNINRSVSIGLSGTTPLPSLVHLNNVYKKLYGGPENLLANEIASNELFLEYVTNKPGNYSLFAAVENSISSVVLPRERPFSVLVEKEPTVYQNDNASFSDSYTSSVSLSVESVTYIEGNLSSSDVVNDTSNAYGSDVKGHIAATLNLTFRSDERRKTFDVEVDYGSGEKSETFLAVSSSSPNPTRVTTDGRKILPLRTILREIVYVDGRSAVSADNFTDASPSEKTVVVTYTSSVVGIFGGLVSETRELVVKVTVSSNVSTSVMTSHAFLTLLKSIGRFELLSSSTIGQPLIAGSSVVLSSLVEFNDRLSFVWTCTVCSTPCQKGLFSNGTYWHAWSLCQMDRNGKGVLRLNVSNGHSEKSRSINFEVYTPIDSVVVSSAKNFTKRDANATEAIEFTAEVKGGSGVMVSFDFGDRTTSPRATCTAKPGSSGSGAGICVAKVRHVFNQSKAFFIKATAYNSIGKPVESPLYEFIVQDPILGLKFIQPVADKVGTGVPVLFKVGSTQGSDLMFNWTVGSVQRYENTGPSVNHTFSRPEKYSVTVVAFNKVSTAQKTKDVIAQVELTEVDFDCSGFYVVTDRPVNCRASYGPSCPPSNVDEFVWSFVPAEAEHAPGGSDVVTTTYVEKLDDLVLGREGLFNVTLTLKNSLGSITSKEKRIISLKLLDDVKISLNSTEVIPGQLVTFVVSQYEVRSTVQYQWNFGDGSEIVNSTDGSVTHVYAREGRYEVVVNASNQVSHSIGGMVLFAVNGRCWPPKVSFINTSAVNYSRYDNIIVESRVDVDCNMTGTTNHVWIVQNADNNSVVKVFQLRDNTLVIPSFALPYGNYAVLLNVTMMGTIVYSVSNKTYDFQILQNPIEAIIFGGFHRSIYRNGLVVMDATSSFDPDFPEFQNLSYSWRCTDYSIKPVHQSCFEEGMNPPSDWPIFKFSAYDLLQLAEFDSGYMFSLVVSRPGRISGVTIQLLSVEETPYIDTSILCKECKLGQINSDNYLTLEAVVRSSSVDDGVDDDAAAAAGGGGDDGVSDSDDLGDGSDDLDYEWIFFDVDVGTKPEPRSQGKCTYSDGSVGDILSIEAPGYKARTTPAPSVVTTTTTLNPQPLNPLENLSPLVGIPARKKVYEKENQKSRADLKAIEYDEKPPEPPIPIPVQVFGLPGLSRSEITILGSQIVGGSTDRKVIRLLPNTLEQNVKYIVKLVVTNKRSKASGWSLMTFKVGNTPREGACTYRKSNDVPFLLSISCFDWGYDDLPLQYQVSYKTDQSAPSVIIYSGLSEEVNFTLPVGIQANNHSVIIQIRITNRRGASTLACSEAFVSCCPELPSMDTVNRTLTSLTSRGANDLARYYAIRTADHFKSAVSNELQLLPLRQQQLPQQHLIPSAASTGTSPPYSTPPLLPSYSASTSATSPPEKFQTSSKFPSSTTPLHAPSISVLRNQLFDVVIPALGSMPIRTMMELEQTLEVLNLILESVTDTPYHMVNETLTIVRRLESNLAGFLSPESYRRYERCNDTKSIVLFIDVASKFFELLASADKDDDGYFHSCSVQKMSVMPQISEESVSNDVYDWRNNTKLSLDDLYGLDGGGGFFPYNPDKNLDLSSLKLRKYAILAVNSLHRIITLKTMLQADDLDILNPPQLIQVGDVISFHSFVHRDPQDPIRRKLADRLRFSIPIDGLAGAVQPGGGSAVQPGGSSGLHDPARTNDTEEKRFEYVPHDEPKRDRCYIVNSLVIDQSKFGFFEEVLNATADNQWFSDLMSLKVHTCQGQEVVVESFPTGERLEMKFPMDYLYGNNSENKKLPEDQFVITKRLINIHELELSTNQEKDDIHVDLDFVMPSPERYFFPIFILFRVKNQPSMTEYDERFFIKPANHSFTLTFNVTKYSKDVKKIYLGIVNQLYKVPKKQVTLYNYERRYSIKVWSLRCVYLHTMMLNWTSAGCRTAEGSTYRTAKCTCNHMTTFSGQMSLFTSVLVQKPADMPRDPINNYTSIIFLSCTAAVYLVLLIVCRSMDREDSKRLPIVNLCDNSPLQRQRYNVIVETGFRPGAGTTAKVSIVLHGKYGMSETRELTTSSFSCPTAAAAAAASSTAALVSTSTGNSPPTNSARTQHHEKADVSERRLFQRNSRDVFHMTLPESLGPIFKVQLWHNNSGSSPSWYLGRVTVHDLCTGDVFYFVFERWFAVDKEDGKVEREVFASDKGLGFFKLLKAKGTQYLADQHLWFSVFFRPPFSRFTRCQRLSCCLSLFSCYMALCALFYSSFVVNWRRMYLFGKELPYTNDIDDDDNAEDDLLFIYLGLSGHQIVIGITSTLVAVFPNLLVQFMFRRSKVSHREESAAKSCLPQRRSSSSQRANVGGGNGDNAAAGNQSHGQQQQQQRRPAIESAVISWRALQEWVFAKQYLNSHEAVGADQMIINPVVTQNDAYIESLESSPADDANNQESSGDRVKRMNEKNRNISAILGNHLSSDTVQTGASFIPDKTSVPIVLDSVDSGGSLAGREIGKNPFFPESFDHRSNRSSVKSDVTTASSSGTEISKPPTKSTRFFLPHHFAIVAWLLTIATSGLSVAGTIYLTFSFSEEKSLMWLQAVFFSFLQCIFINQPLIVLSLSVYTAVRYRGSMLAFDHYKDGYFESAIEMNDPIFGSHKNSDLHSDESLANRLQDKSEVDINVEQGLLARQRSRYLRLVRPPQEQKLIEARHQTMKETNAVAFIREIVLISIQLCLMIIICFGISSSPDATYRINRLLTDSFISRGMRHSYENASSLKSWDLWYEHVFNPSLNRILEDDYLLVGGLKLRQLRIRDIGCTSAKHQLIPVTRCLRLYGDADLLVDDFMPSNLEKTRLFANATRRNYSDNHFLRDRIFLPLEKNRSVCFSVGRSGAQCRENLAFPGDADEYSEFAQLPVPDYYSNDSDEVHDDEDAIFLSDESIWKYKSEEDTTFASYKGWFGNYGGGGFVLDLSAIKGSNGASPMKFLSKNGWVDKHTAVLILALTFYHPPSNLFSSLALTAELPPIGQVFPTHKVATVSIYKYFTVSDRVVYACELLFFVLTFAKVHYKICCLFQQGGKRFIRFWNVLEVIMCLLSISFIGCYIYRFFVITETLENIMAAFYQDTEVDVFTVANWDQILRTHLGVILIVLCMFLLKSLQRHERFASLLNVVRRSTIDLVVLAFVAISWLGAFVSCGMVVFGSSRAQFADVARALVHGASALLFRPTIRDASGREDFSSIPLWVFFHGLFLLLALAMLAAYVKASLLFNFRVFRGEPMLVFTSKENLSFYWLKVKKFFRLPSQKCTEVESRDDPLGAHLFDQLLPEFTMTEMENQVDEVLFKMNALTGDSNLPQKPVIYYTDSDVTFGTNEDGLSSGHSDQNRNRHSSRTPVNASTNDLDHHRNMLIKLELLVMKQLKQQTASLEDRQQQQQHSLTPDPQVEAAILSPAKLSTSSPQLSGTRKGEDRSVESRLAAKRTRSINVKKVGRPPLPRNGSSLSCGKGSSLVSDVIISLSPAETSGSSPSSVVATAVQPNAATVAFAKSFSSAGSASSSGNVLSAGMHRFGTSRFPPLHLYRPSVAEVGLRRSRSVRCRRLETMVEEIDDRDGSSLTRRGKSADANVSGAVGGSKIGEKLASYDFRGIINVDFRSDGRRATETAGRRRTFNGAASSNCHSSRSSSNVEKPKVFEARSQIPCTCLGESCRGEAAIRIANNSTREESMQLHRAAVHETAGAESKEKFDFKAASSAPSHRRINDVSKASDADASKPPIANDSTAQEGRKQVRELSSEKRRSRKDGDKLPSSSSSVAASQSGAGERRRTSEGSRYKRTKSLKVIDDLDL